MEFTCNNLEQISKIAKLFLENLKTKPNQAVIVGLVGDLGSGKTTFTQKVAEELGIREVVTSPTFVIEKKYKVPILVGSQFKQLIHIDCYRLKNGSDLINLDWQEIINDSGNLIVVEWPEIVEEIIPPDSWKIYFEFIDENTRKIKLPWPNKK